MADPEQIAHARKFVTDRLGLKVREIESHGRVYNNFTYKIALDDSGDSKLLQSSAQPGTVPFPLGAQSVILRIPNPDASLNHAVRVEHEVAALALVRSSGSGFLKALIPDVYSWANVSEDNDGGWVLSQCLPGINVGSEFPRLPAERQKIILSQLAQVLKALQDLLIPSTADRYGGLRFNDAGDVVSGPAALPLGDPVDRYQDLYKATLRRQLELSDTSEFIGGWKDSSMRVRLERFFADGLDEVFTNLCISDRKTFVHGDLSAGNILVDPETYTITGVVDFEFSHIASPLEEFLYSFHDVHGLLPGAHTSDTGLIQLRDSLLHGFPNPLPESPPPPTGPVRFGSKRNIQWQLAKAWDEELEATGVLRPATLPYADDISRVHWFVQDICPFYFLQSMWLDAVGEERAAEERAKQHDLLDQYLKGWGY